MKQQQLIDTANARLAREGFAVRPITASEVSARVRKPLLAAETSAKALKASDTPYLNAILYLAPGDIVGQLTCVNFDSCFSGCLFFAGMGGDGSVARARTVKTLGLFLHPDQFKARLARDIQNLKKTAAKHGKKLVVRLNGTSDLNPKVFGAPADSEVVRYEYTKVLAFALMGPARGIHYTFSHHGNTAESVQALRAGVNVAVVFHGSELPAEWNGYQVIDGDTHDLRFLDQPGVVVGLRAKRGGFSQSKRRTQLSECNTQLTALPIAG